METDTELGQQLVAYRSADFQKKRLANCRKLKVAARETGNVFLGRKPDGTAIKIKDQWKAYSAQLKQLEKAAEKLEKLSDAQRQQLFAALFPSIAEHVEGAWQLLHHQPYQETWGRRPFRAPNLSQVTANARCQFVVQLITLTEEYDQPITWWAEWGAHLGGEFLSPVFAACIATDSKEGEQVLVTLIDGAQGEHAVAQMGSHVISSLLTCPREDAWQYIEKMLLAAQRQEGLRQSILERADMGAPEAFWRMVRLILDENLIRFAATVRAVDVWFGLLWDSASTAVVKKVLTRVLELHDQESALQAALKGDDAESAYLGLVVLAFDDVETAIPPAKKMLRHKQPAIRFAAALFLSQVQLPQAEEKLVHSLSDSDDRVAFVAVSALADGEYTNNTKTTAVFDQLEALFKRFPKKKTKLEPLLWPWYEIAVERDSIGGAMINNLGNYPVEKLFPHVSEMGADSRAYVAIKISEQKEIGSQARGLLLKLTGDPSEFVRRYAFEGLKKAKLSVDEAEHLESLLTRKSSDLRRGILSALLTQNDRQTLASAERLLATKKTLQRQAGLQLLQQLIKKSRSAKKCRLAAQGFRDSLKKLPAAEKSLLEELLSDDGDKLTLEDALGLLDRAKLTPISPLQKKNVAITSKAAANVILSLDELIQTHREAEFESSQYGSSETVMLGYARYQFPRPDHKVTLAEDLARLPLAEVWKQWLADRDEGLRDDDSLELMRAKLLLEVAEDSNKKVLDAAKKLFGTLKPQKLRYPIEIAVVLDWLIRMSETPNLVATLLDWTEYSFGSVSSKMLDSKESKQLIEPKWKAYNSPYMQAYHLADHHRWESPNQWSDEQLVKLWHLKRWLGKPFAGERPIPFERPYGNPPELSLLCVARASGDATNDDVLFEILGTRPHLRNDGFTSLNQVTRRKPPDELKQYAWLQSLADRCRDRVLEVELKRGDTPTVASHAALALASVPGIESFVRILVATGKDALVRGHSWSDESKKAVCSHLLRVSYPTKEDTSEAFVEAVKQAQLSEVRLLEVAMFAPQWAAMIEQAVGWEGLESAVWWIHAHTKDTNWYVDQEVKEEWEAAISLRTPLSPKDLVDGAVDVEWFNRVYAKLKKSRWTKLGKAAKYASSGGGHKRAELFADAMLNVVNKTELLKRINEKRHQDAVRALGLLPLARGKSREMGLLSRYRRFQEFVRESRQFGSQRQASEKRAALIGQENLARSAGFRDPIRLQWAMEAQAVADLADGPIELELGDTKVSLGISETAEVELVFEKAGKTLKSAPAAIKKNKQFLALRERRKEIKKQVARIRPTLEQMMCRGEEFSLAELRELMSHTLIRPLLSRLLLCTGGGIGYPQAGGDSLSGVNGKSYKLKAKDSLRIAHPDDLFTSGNWPDWQSDCFQREIVQPFKQVFREYYPLTTAEKKEKTQSRRYAGQQVNPRQALALLGGRGWATIPEEGVFRTFHEHGITASLTFQEAFYTPADIDGLTLETVEFTEVGDWKPLELESTSSRLFSEVMRDLDLVVSVAHRGGVDPEASASTIEMRSDLLRETLALVDIENVRIEKNHAKIKGELGSYSVHLGSAVTHRLPGGALFIVAVHSQHRGRMFLPFADDDPKTAEVISKVLLLAEDRQIKDPNILDQIRR